MPTITERLAAAAETATAAAEAGRLLAKAADLLGDVLASGVAFEDPRIDYLEMQIDRRTLDAIRELLVEMTAEQPYTRPERSRRAIVRLTPNAFVEWSSSCDAPAGVVMTRAEVEAVLDPMTLARIDLVGHTFVDPDGRPSAGNPVAANRAGPGETSLTAEAITRRYSADPAVREAFELRPDDIAPYTTGFACEPDDPNYGKVFWVPWPPGEAPAIIDDTTDLQAMVPADPATLPKA